MNDDTDVDFEPLVCVGIEVSDRLSVQSAIRMEIFKAKCPNENP